MTGGVSAARAVELARLAYEAWNNHVGPHTTWKNGEQCIETFDDLRSYERNAWVEAVYAVLRASDDARAKGAGR